MNPGTGPCPNKGCWISKSEPVLSKSSCLEVKLSNRLIDQIKKSPPRNQTHHYKARYQFDSLFVCVEGVGLVGGGMCCIPVSMSVALCVGYAADRPSNHISYPTCVLVLLVRPGERKSPWCHHRPAMTSSAWTANFNCPSASTSHSLSFSVASASYGAGSCYDPYIYCLELGALSTSASAGGNFFAIANSSNSLWLNAFCKAYAAAYAQACTFTKVDGDIKVETSKTNRYKGVSLSVTLKTATKSLAYASSVAVAKSFVDAGAYSYTDVAAFLSRGQEQIAVLWQWLCRDGFDASCYGLGKSHLGC
jgi:hypothetical protein